MDIKKSSKLPDGVGKKIIEALKKQSVEPVERVQPKQESSFDEQFDHSQMNNVAEEFPTYQEPEAEIELWDQNEQISFNEPAIPEANFDDFEFVPENDEFDSQKTEISESPLDDDFEIPNYEQESAYSPFNEEDEPELIPETSLEAYELYEDNPMVEEQDIIEPGMQEEKVEYEKFVPKYNPAAHEKHAYSEPLPQRSRINKSYMEERYEPIDYHALELNAGSNVSILMRLISRLPAGVTRQTGAQIIRQTMEAMGISMNKVLTEAQQLQDELAESIRDNINTIEEYRNNIRTLEKEVQNCRKQSEELEDLISLFIMSDKNIKRPI